MNCVECDNPVIENKELNLCASCNHARRKSERNSKKVSIVAPIKKVSESRAAELIEYRKLRKEYLLTHMACEARLPGCFMTSTEIHHLSLSSLNFLNPDTYQAVCRSCHNKIEREMSAEDRRQLGLLIN